MAMLRRAMLLHGRRALCTAPRVSFLERARHAGDASALIGTFPSAGRFDGFLEEAGMRIESVTEGEVRCSLRVGEPLSNNFGTMHGGCIVRRNAASTPA